MGVALRSLRRSISVEPADTGATVGRHQAHLLLPRQGLLSLRLVAGVEAALEAVDPLLRCVMGAWQAPGG